MATNVWRGVAPWLFLGVSGCGPREPVKEPETRQPALPAPAAAAPVETTKASESPRAAPAAPPAEEAKAVVTAPPEPSHQERVAAVCERHCTKVEGACKAQTAEICRANCESYVIQSERCPVEVLRALTCRTEAEEVVLCSVMVPDSCTKAVATMKDCVAGKTPSASVDDASGEVPPGFAPLDAEGLGIRLLLPVGATRSEGGGNLRYGASLGGIDYFAESVPGAAAKPSDKTILRSALSYLGHDCESKLKLHGRFDKDGAIFVRFDATCKDTTLWHGMFVVLPEKMVSVAARRGPGVSTEFGDLDPILFGVSLANKK